MISKIELPTQLKPILALYDESFDISEKDFKDSVEKSIMESDHVLFENKNGVSVNSFILAKTSTLRGRKCVEVLAVHCDRDRKSLWKAMVKKILKWADQQEIQDVYILRNLRRR